MVPGVKPVDLIGLTLEAGSGAPVVLLREHDVPRRVLPIFVGPTEATAIALALSGRLPPRPLTHDLLAVLVETLHAHVERVEVTELRDGTFFAELALSGPTGQRRLDSRPSDAIALAVRVDAPLFVSGVVLDEAGATLAEPLDERAIDEAVAQFRTALDTLDPGELRADPAGEAPAANPEQGESADVDPPGEDAAEGDTEPGSGADHPPDSPGG
jgi:bifunctional DNase/RNase